EAMRRREGRSRSPRSASTSPRTAANSEDLPVPLRPTTPTRQPACNDRSTSDRSRRSPRRKAKLRKEIIRTVYRAARPGPRAVTSGLRLMARRGGYREWRSSSAPRWRHGCTRRWWRVRPFAAVQGALARQGFSEVQMRKLYNAVLTDPDGFKAG